MVIATDSKVIKNVKSVEINKIDNKVYLEVVGFRGKKMLFRMANMRIAEDTLFHIRHYIICEETSSYYRGKSIAVILDSDGKIIDTYD